MSGLQHSHLAIPLLGPNPERSLRAWRIGPFPLLIMLIVFVSSFSGGQELKRQDEAEVREESVPLGQQLPTANALRAPIKAQRAVERATAAMARNQPREAQKQLAYALDLYPDYANALTLRAIWNMSANRVDSMKDLERAIQLDPAYGVAYAVLGSIYNDAERYDDAFPLIQRAMQLLPSAWPVHYEMARALGGKHRELEALREVTEAERGMSVDTGANPTSRASVHYLRAMILVSQQDYASAILEFQLTLKEEPGGDLVNRTNRILTQLESQGIH